MVPRGTDRRLAAKVDHKNPKIGRRDATDARGLTQGGGSYSIQLLAGLNGERGHSAILCILVEFNVVQPRKLLCRCALLVYIALILGPDLHLLDDLAAKIPIVT